MLRVGLTRYTQGYNSSRHMERLQNMTIFCHTPAPSQFKCKDHASASEQEYVGNPKFLINTSHHEVWHTEGASPCQLGSTVVSLHASIRKAHTRLVGVPKATRLHSVTTLRQGWLV